MEHAKPILVYPGGAHEVMKKKSDKRYGFTVERVKLKMVREAERLMDLNCCTYLAA